MTVVRVWLASQEAAVPAALFSLMDFPQRRELWACQGAQVWSISNAV